MKKSLFAIVCLSFILLQGGVAFGACTGSLFNDVNSSVMSAAFCDFIERFSTYGITSGCEADNPATPQNEARFCPDDFVTRRQMAVFLTTTIENVAGDIKSVNAGTGLTGGGTTGNVTLNVQFAGNGSATTASRSNHHHNAVYQKKYGNVAVVALSGGDYTDPVTAMSAIASWCGTPSAVNPCLLKIMPGVYDIGTATLQMEQYVDIEGSGEIVTVVRGSVSGSTFPPTEAVVKGNTAEIRQLTVENVGTVQYVVAFLNESSSPSMRNLTVNAPGGGTNCYGLYNKSSSMPSMVHVTARASSCSQFNIGIQNDGSSPRITDSTAIAVFGLNSYGIQNVSSSSPTLTNVRAAASGATNNAGIRNQSSSPTLINVTATAYGGSNKWGILNVSSEPTLSNVTADGGSGSNSYGMYNTASGGGYEIRIDRSTFEGSTNSIRNDTEFLLYIGASKLVGPVDTAGFHNCAASYNGVYSALNSACQ